MFAVAGIVLGLAVLAAAGVGRSRRLLLRRMAEYVDSTWVISAAPHMRRTKGDRHAAEQLAVRLSFCGWVAGGAALIGMGLAVLGFELAATVIAGALMVGGAAVIGAYFLCWI